MFIDVDSSVLRDTVMPDTSSVIGEDVDPAECVALTLERASEVLGNEGFGSEDVSISVISLDDSVVVVSSVLTIVDVDTSELRDVAVLDISSVLREDVDSAECVELTLGRASEVVGNEGRESEVV